MLIRRDEARNQTRGGIVLPGDVEIPTIQGLLVELSDKVSNDPDYHLTQYSRVLFDPRNGIPVEFELDNRMFIVPVKDIIAVIE